VRLAWIGAALALALLLFAGSASANEQRELMRQAEAAERSFEPARALSLYQRALDRDGRSRLARRIRARLAWLEARSEQGYQPLTRLLEMQTTPRVELQRAELERFTAEVADFPPGLVRREALAFVAATWLDHFDDPRRALEAYRAWLASPDISEADRQLAATGVALTQARLEGDAAALAELEAAGLGQSPQAVALRAGRIGAIGTLAAAISLLAFLALGLASGGWRGVARLRQLVSPARLAIGAYVLGLPVWLAWRYDPRFGLPMTKVVLAMAAVVGCAALFGVGLSRSGASLRRVKLLAALSAFAVIAAGFVALAGSQLLLGIMLSMAATS
jgi:hypothetical protein